MPKKEYKSVLVKQKTGRTTPITKLVKPCPLCGFDMFIDHSKKGGVHKRSKKYWACSEVKLCGHRELEEGSQDKYIRMGAYDDSIGILPLYEESNTLSLDDED